MTKSNTIVKNQVWKGWDPSTYLKEYFQTMGPDVKATTKFVTEELSKFRGKQISKVLEFGSGPTIIGVIGAPPYVREIHVADYLERNRKEIKKWLRNDPRAFSHDHLIAFVLGLEGIKPTAKNIQERSKTLRKKIKKVLFCDANLTHPLKTKTTYPLIISLYCADSATHSKRVWGKFMKNITGLLAPGGVILLTALRKSKFYRIGNVKFPSANIDESDLKKVFLKNGFVQRNIHIKTTHIVHNKSEEFSSLLLARVESML